MNSAAAAPVNSTDFWNAQFGIIICRHNLPICNHYGVTDTLGFLLNLADER